MPIEPDLTEAVVASGPVSSRETSRGQFLSSAAGSMQHLLNRCVYMSRDAASRRYCHPSPSICRSWNSTYSSVQKCELKYRCEFSVSLDEFLRKKSSETCGLQEPTTTEGIISLRAFSLAFGGPIHWQFSSKELSLQELWAGFRKSQASKSTCRLVEILHYRASPPSDEVERRSPVCFRPSSLPFPLPSCTFASSSGSSSPSSIRPKPTALTKL